jgi:hypothetical protein
MRRGWGSIIHGSLTDPFLEGVDLDLADRFFAVRHADRGIGAADLASCV